jgi:hypothetical protein
MPLVCQGWVEVFDERHERNRFAVSVGDILVSNGRVELTFGGGTTSQLLQLKPQFVDILRQVVGSKIYCEMIDAACCM